MATAARRSRCLVRGAAEAAAHPDRPVLFITAVAPTILTPPNLFVLAPGGASANAGLVRASARIEGDRWWLLVAARSDASAPAASLRVEADGKPLTNLPNFLAPGKSAEQVFAQSDPPPRELAVRLVPASAPAASAVPLGDSFAWDDTACLALTPSTHLRVAMIGEPDLALRRGLSTGDDADVVSVASGEKLAAGEADLVVANRAALPAGWDGPAVVILPPTDVGPVHPAATTAAPSAEWKVVPQHPLAESLYLEPPHLTGAGAYRIDPSAQVLVGTREAPLIVTWDEAGVRRLAVLFDLGDTSSDWSHRASFPIFWSRALDWLVPKDRRSATLTTSRPLEPVPGWRRAAPAAIGFGKGPRGEPVGVSFIGSGAGFVSGSAATILPPQPMPSAARPRRTCVQPCSPCGRTLPRPCFSSSYRAPGWRDDSRASAAPPLSFRARRGSGGVSTNCARM